MKLKTLMHASDKEREETISKFLAESKTSSPRDVESEIMRYETRFGYSTEEMRRRIRVGELTESRSICDWLILADLRAQSR